MALLLSLPVSSAFAQYENGKYELGVDFTVTGLSNAARAFDGDINTNATIGGLATATITFHEPVLISGIKSTHLQMGYVSFDDLGNELLSYNVPSTNGQLVDHQAYIGDKLKDKKIKKINVRSPLGSSMPIHEIQIFGPSSIKHDPVNDLVVSDKTTDSIVLSWQNPETQNRVGTQIFSDGLKIATLPVNDSTYTIKGLKPGTTYYFDVYARYSDDENSKPVSLLVVTEKEPPPGEVEDLSATPKHDRVDLSWRLPKSNNLKHVIIYRDTLQKSFFDKMFGVATVKAATPIFETNGTYFNDLTVEPETKYEYKLTTLSTEKIESDGVTVQVTTLKEPDPKIEGGRHEKDPVTGDFAYTWNQPTSGEVRVMVGGKLYATIPASDGRIVIPAADMRYTILSEPDVSLIPVSESGLVGPEIKPPPIDGGTGGMIDSVKVPFGANDVLKAGTGLFWIIGPFVLLALAFLLVPKLRQLVVQAFSGKKDGVGSPGRRFSDENERVREERVARERTVKEPRERRFRAISPERPLREPRARVREGRLSRAERGMD